jgi:multiple sugar transport system permease protein
VTIVPFAWTLLTSIQTDEAIHAWPPQWIPKRVVWEHYRELFSRMDFARIFLNSAIVTVGVTAVSLFLNSLGGYVFAKFRFPFRDRLFVLLLITMMVPMQVTMIPVFLILKSLGLLNSYLGLILPGGVSVFGIFLMRQFMLSIPDSYIESGRIDGCSEFRIYRSIVLPLCVPALTALGIFTFTGVWSDFLMPLIVLHRESMYTLPVALANLSGQHTARWGLMMAGSTVVILPIALLFLVLQRKFIAGVTMSGVKG